MRIIVPMAGMGKRMRPHTLTTPKPVVPVAGKPIVQHLVEDIIRMCNQKVEEIAFVVGHFGEEAEKNLIAIAENLGAKGTIHYQDTPLGTAHAILCAESALKGPVVVAFADTLFSADFRMDADCDGVIWVKQIEDPRQFGVVKTEKDGTITDFVEKPQEFVSDLAIIGIYYLKDGENLKKELQYLIDNNIRDKGEYQLTNALENMKTKGLRLKAGKVDEWLDCGNKDATVYTNRRVLEIKYPNNHISDSAQIKNSVIIPPCYIGDKVVIENSVVGPHVSAGNNTKIVNSVVKNSIVREHCTLRDAGIDNSLIGNHVHYKQQLRDLSMGDYSTES
ncbi:MAG TPA: sugar phosphate nucleotidyltransferase [Bacteroidia bacterium]|jgi:glucose-1-phosphate thymidylyltransferase|nr:sugar phosphate nucleotidyltransferase [Bacteroidia bacterium]HQF28000.1 sugar phosphate nucleotidyltransferase [Bacteroidia bacterium]HQK96645.1 sugar phosphate nucleotidyltransferase [Bacteroidia bacterium]